MDEFKTGKAGGQNSDKSIPFNDGLSVSHAPLDFGGGSSSKSTSSASSSSSSSASSEPAEDMPMPIIKDTGKKVSWPDRITGVKTFYTKLHGGAIEFLDDIICKWLMDNPGVTIKRTNTVVGDIVGKKTEPSIIITIWY